MVRSCIKTSIAALCAVREEGLPASWLFQPYGALPAQAR
jgi:hypothetical protein